MTSECALVLPVALRKPGRVSILDDEILVSRPRFCAMPHHQQFFDSCRKAGRQHLTPVFVQDRRKPAKSSIHTSSRPCLAHSAPFTLHILYDQLWRRRVPGSSKVPVASVQALVSHADGGTTTVRFLSARTSFSLTKVDRVSSRDSSKPC